MVFNLIPCRKSLNLSETLLRLAEAGHYETVKSLFAFPLKHCPDVLLLALLQINVSNTVYALTIVQLFTMQGNEYHYHWQSCGLG